MESTLVRIWDAKNTVVWPAIDTVLEMRFMLISLWVRERLRNPPDAETHKRAPAFASFTETFNVPRWSQRPPSRNIQKSPNFTINRD